uniref:Putative m13 family peptidase n=1 Tax=Amblyomma triste TaxID=251400 RepID=A0A023GNH6_AMBTT
MRMFFIAALLIMVNLLPSKGDLSDLVHVGSDPEYEVCRSPECNARVNLIEKFINESVEPCDDFYSYACGGWLNTILNHEEEYDISKMLQGNVQGKLKSIIENMYISVEDQNVAHKAGLFYKACVEFPNETNKQRGWQSILQNGNLSEWPIMHDDSATQDWINGTELLLNLGLSSLFNIHVRRLPHEDSNFLQLHHVPLKHKTSSAAKYKDADRDEVIKYVIRTLKPNISDDLLVNFTTTIQHFERTLNNLGTANRVTRFNFDNDKWFVKNHPTAREKYMGTQQPIQQFQEMAPSIPLLASLRNMFLEVNINVTEEDNVTIQTKDYYKNLGARLDENNRDLLSKIYDYAGVRKINTLVGNWKMLLGLLTENDTEKRRNQCLQLVKREMPDVVSYIFANHSFDLKAREQVQKIAESIKNMLIEVVDSSISLENSTKEAIIKKVNSTRTTFGYSSNLFDMDILESRYAHIPKLEVETSFLDILASVQRNKKLNELKEWKGGEGGETPSGITVIRKGIAYCDHRHLDTPSHLVFPIEFFQEPFFTKELPWSLNFGGFGSAYAHQLLHHIHTTVHRDDKGYTSVTSCDMFTGNDSSCNTATQCLLQQYRMVIEPVYNQTVEVYIAKEEESWKEAAAMYYYNNFLVVLDRHMPGYIGDNSGISIVLKAYRKLLQEECDDTETRLEGLEQYSGTQLLLLTRAMAMCGTMNEANMNDWMTNKQHSPYKYRVNLPMENSGDFAKAFNCTEDSNLYKKDEERCTLW